MTNLIYQRVRDRKNQPKGILVAKKTRSGTVKIGYSLTNFKAGDKFDLQAGLNLAINRADKGTTTEVPNSIRNDYLDMVNRACRYFFKNGSVKVVPVKKVSKKHT
jgi:hypothetical protein